MRIAEPASYGIEMVREDLPILADAARAARAILYRQRYRHELPTERARRLLWTCLVDRYQLRPDVVAEFLDGPQPAKEYLGTLDRWVTRPEDRSDDNAAGLPPLRSTLAQRYRWYGLVGMSGVGKSAAGAALARRLGSVHADLDTVVEAHHGEPLSRMFLRLGSLRTLQRYRDAVDGWLTLTPPDRPTVVSFGAGSALLPGIASVIRRCDHSAWLTASPRTLLKRLAADPGHSAHGFADREFYPLLKFVQIGRAPIFAIARRRIDASGTLDKTIDCLAHESQRHEHI